MWTLEPESTSGNRIFPAKRATWFEVVIARCEVASLNDGCQWALEDTLGPSDIDAQYYYSYKAATPDSPVSKQLNDGLHKVGARNPFPRDHYRCIKAPACPAWKEVQRCCDNMSILITRYQGKHNHPLPTVMASTVVSNETSTFTQASLPLPYQPYHGSYMIKMSSHPPNIKSINPNNPNPSKGIVLDFTSDSDDPPQFMVDKSLVRDQDQNQAPKILVVEDPNKEVQSNPSTTSTSFSRPHCNYDVFLSFKGEDTRKNFTDHLYSALVQQGIRTFRDDEELPRGYASSKWCLNELVEIVQCENKNTIGHTLLPIFYQVKPSDVRKQTETFAEAFAMHEEQFQTDMKMVQRWREALTEAANCSGWDLESLANGYESKFIKQILEEILCKVNPAPLHVAKHEIGIMSRVNDIKDLLNLGTTDVRVVGIYGMGGIGKTTLAKAVYNEICAAFEGSSFLSNFKESLEKSDGLVHLQEQFLNDILKMNLKIDNGDRGISIITERICGKKVLVVVDDVDDFEKLHSLVEKEWLGPGSRIIITTRDEHVLSPLRADKKYKVRELDDWESLQLFRWHAFEMINPKEDYSELSIKAIRYAGGIPLVLVLLGSFLKDRSVVEWESELKKLEITPYDKIQNVLRISFDSLDEYTKGIFLDIACFFVDMDEKYVMKILDGCNFFPKIGIPILIQKSLVTIDDKKILRMHSLIRDMGREIIHGESPNLPGKRSRLWFHEDASNVLHEHTGIETVEGLILKVFGKDIHIKTEAFTNMKSLRLLQIDYVHPGTEPEVLMGNWGWLWPLLAPPSLRPCVHLKGSYEHLSEKLRWLRWHKCHLQFLPQNFHLENLVILDMQYSNLKQVWKKNKILNKLKVLNLSHSKYLTKSPNFFEMPQLETLILEGCTSLVEIHVSIGCLKNLVLLNLNGCKSLMNLPSSISNLRSLKTLDLSGCLQVDKLPDQVGSMIALTELLADGIAIKQLPSSFGLLKNLEIASLSRPKEQSSKSWLSLLLSLMSPKSLNPLCFLPPSISGLRSLTKLNLSGRNLSEDMFPVDFESLSSLKFLDLSRNNFRNLPDGIGRLSKLFNFQLQECTTLQSISGLFSSVAMLDASNCTSMERLSVSSNRKSGLYLYLRNCHKLTEIQGSENREISAIHNQAYNFMSHLQCPLTMGDDESRVIFLPGSEVPNWFSHRGHGVSVSFHVPSISKGQFLRLLICVVCSFNATFDIRYYRYHLGVNIRNKTRGNSKLLLPNHNAAFEDEDSSVSIMDRFYSVPQRKKGEKYHLFLFLTPLIRNKYELESGLIFNELVMESGEEIEVRCGHWQNVDVKKCGVHVVVDEPKVT
ncbi:disease resistance protein RUN1-like isoform X3 [Alnus glutinosa]|uniref:disease resistance protein RUN1-like isoform X3 n=1 Tax=Alnus glutinosa TaxID=3517 RepID=UPI002D780AAA|nr:disease resistance protein RUN1-like isoform X3 [Alnus glutinosa]